MNNLINSITSKYIVNILMILIFLLLAISGIFFMEEGEGRERGNDRNQQQFSGNRERYDRNENHGPAYFNRDAGFAGERREGGDGSDGIHQTAGIMWLILMFLHTWQHWNWYKKLFTLQHIMQNKLLTITIFLLVLLVISTIGLGKEIHGLIGQVLTGLVLIHIIQRFKWYITITQKLLGKKLVTASTN